MECRTIKSNQRSRFARQKIQEIDKTLQGAISLLLAMCSAVFFVSLFLLSLKKRFSLYIFHHMKIKGELKKFS